MNLPKIYSAFLNVTNACNLACRYCFVEQHPNYMTFHVAKDAVDFLQKNAAECGAIPSITFFGGEPMICWESVVKPIISYIRHEYSDNYSMSMTTNGTLLTEERLKYLVDNNVDILLSIDGAKETQDYNRPRHDGSGSFDSIDPLLPSIIKNYPNMVFRSTLIPETANYLFENIKFASDTGYSCFFTIPNVFQEWKPEDKAVVEEQFKKYADFFIESCLAGSIPIRCSPLEEAFRDITQINFAITNNLRQGSNTVCQKCGLGTSSFVSVDYTGNVYACQEMASCKGDGDPFWIGNIYTGISDLHRERLAKSFDPQRLKGDDCATCQLQRVCDGGCAANNYLSGGSVNTVSSTYCWWVKLMLKEAIRIMDQLGNAECEVFKAYWANLRQNGGLRCPNMLTS